MPPLSVLKVRNARHPGGDKSVPIRMGDGAGLYLQVTTSHAKSWVYRFKLDGSEYWMGLGSADADGKDGLSLAEARDAAAVHRKLARAGQNPLTERQRLQEEQCRAVQRGLEQTFRKAAEACIEAKKGGWRSGKHAKQWEATLLAYVYPALGAKHVAEITTVDVAEVLRPIWLTIPETATRLRQRIESILDFAAAPSRRWRTGENPARWKGVLQYELPKPAQRGTRHLPSLPRNQINAFMAELDKHKGMAAVALKFLILTGARSGSVRKARWSEIDLENAVWACPRGHMKGARPLRVPLSSAALDLLGKLKDQTRDWPGSLVFPSSQTDTLMTDQAISELVKGMAMDGLAEGELPRWRDEENRRVVPHGFRTTFKSWARSVGYEDHLSEIGLAHVDKDKSRAAYAREDLLEERRPMMEAWGRHCTGPAASVTEITTAFRHQL